MGRFEEILQSIAPAGASRYVVPPRSQKGSPVRTKKKAAAEPPKGPQPGENVDALEKLISGASRKNRVDDVVDSTLARADEEANKPTKGQGSRTPIRREYPAEEIRDLIATPEGLAELKRHIGDDPGSRKQKAIRAALYARNKSWADEFDIALAGDTPAKKLDAGYEGPSAGEGSAADAAEGDGVYISPPDDPKLPKSPRRERGKKNDAGLHITEVGDVTLVRKRMPEPRAKDVSRIAGDDRDLFELSRKKKIADDNLSVNMANVRDDMLKAFRSRKYIDPKTGKPYAKIADFERDHGRNWTGTKLRDEYTEAVKDAPGKRGYKATPGEGETQEVAQRRRAVNAAGLDPARPEGSTAGAPVDDFVQASDITAMHGRQTQPATERADFARRAVRDRYRNHGEVLSFLRQASDDTAVELAYKAARDIVNEGIPVTERATAVANHDAVYGVMQGLFAAADRKIPTVLPEWFSELETKAQKQTDKLFPGRGPRSAAQPSRTPPPSGPLNLPNKRFDPTIDAKPELDPKPTLPVEQRPQGKVPKNIEEELADYHAGLITDPDQKAYLEDVIQTRRIAVDNTLDENGKPIAGLSRKTRVRSKNTVLPESSDVTVADTPTTPGDDALNEGTDMGTTKGKVVEAITGAAGAGKPGRSQKGAPKRTQTPVAVDTAAESLDADSGGKAARPAAGDASSTRGQVSTVPLTERYSALAEDARNSDPSRAAEMNDRLAALDDELIKLDEKSRQPHFEAAGAAESAVKGLGAPPAKAAATTAQPAAGGRGKKPPAAPPPAAADNTEEWGDDIFRRMVTEEWEKARTARKDVPVPYRPPVPEPAAPKPAPKPKAAAKAETQVGTAEDAADVTDGNVDVTRPRRTRVRRQPEVDTSEMEAARMAGEGGMEPVGPNPQRYEREWDQKQAQLEDEAYKADLDRRQRAVADAAARKVADEQARRAQYSSQWDNAGAAVDGAHANRLEAMARRQADDQFADDDALTRMDDEGFSRPEPADSVSARIEARRAAEAARRQMADQVFDEDGMSRMDDEGFSRPTPARELERRSQHAQILEDSDIDRMEGEGFSMPTPGAVREVARRADNDRIRRNSLVLAAAAAAAGGIYAATEEERKAAAPAEPPPQVPDRPAETQVGLPDDAPAVTIGGEPEDVLVNTPPARRLPPGYRAPQAARYQAPPEEELVLANPNRDDLVLPDPHAGRDLFLPDPHAGEELYLPDPSRARNSDDPRAKLSRLMKALGR